MVTLIDDSTVWSRRDLELDRDWRGSFSAEEIDALANAVADAVGGGISVNDITQSTFAIPALTARLGDIKHRLDEGCGFSVITGWPASQYDYERNALAFAIVGSHFGEISVQTSAGAKLIDVKDKGVPWDANNRGYDSRAALNFHTDGADVAGLLCLSEGASGGDSFIASASRVFNEIAQQAPHLIDVLREGFHHHRRGEQPPGASPISTHPLSVFSFHNNLLHCCYNRNAIDWAAKAGVTLTARQVEALDVFEEVVNREDVAFRHRLQVGDMSFVNNYAVLHARDGYQDTDNATRHLLRLWINDRNSVRLGPTLQNLYTPDEARYRMQG